VNRGRGSSQSRVAKVEAAADSVSLDLLVRSYLALGASREDLAKVIGSSVRVKASWDAGPLGWGSNAVPHDTL